MRQTDFGAVRRDGSVIVLFADTDLRSAHAIARRLSAKSFPVPRNTSSNRFERAFTLNAAMRLSTCVRSISSICS